MPSTQIDRIDGITTSAAVKTPCRVVSVSNITLSGVQTIDGVLLTAYSGPGIPCDRVLVNGQTDQTTNGIYLVQTGAWTREPDFDGARDAVTGTLIYVRSGTVYADTLWRLTTTDNPILIGTSLISFAADAFATQAPYFQPTSSTLPPTGNGLYLPGVNILGLAAAAALAFAFTNPANAINYWQASGAAAGNAPSLSVMGGDTNISASIATKGTGVFVFFTNTNVRQAQINHVALAVNYWTIQGGATGSGPLLSVTGSDADISAQITSKGAGSIFFLTSAASLNQFAIAHTASAVNYITAAGAASGSGPYFTTSGAGTDIDFNFYTKGNGNLLFASSFGSSIHFYVAGQASCVNYFAVTGATAGNYPLIFALGSDTDIGLQFITKGAGFIGFRTGGKASPLSQMFITHTAVAVNYWSFTGAPTGSSIAVIAGGSDSTVGINISAKGVADINLFTDTATKRALNLTAVASAVNYAQIIQSATGNGVAYAVAGTDTDIDVILTAKGAGLMKVGLAGMMIANNTVATVLGSLGPTGAHTTVQEWLRFKNSAGTVRYVPCF